MSEFEFLEDSRLHSDVLIGEDGHWWIVTKGDDQPDRAWMVASADAVCQLSVWR